MKGNSVILLLWKDTSFSLLKLSDPEVNSFICESSGLSTFLCGPS